MAHNAPKKSKSPQCEYDLAEVVVEIFKKCPPAPSKPKRVKTETNWYTNADVRILFLEELGAPKKSKSPQCDFDLANFATLVVDLFKVCPWAPSKPKRVKSDPICNDNADVRRRLEF
jgi:hypothetical protein